MIDVKVAHNVERVLAEMAQIPARFKERAIKDALRRTATGTKTVVTRAITREYVIQRSQVDPAIRIFPKFGSGYSLAVEIDALPSRSGRRAANVIKFMERRVSLAQHRRRQARGDRQLHFRFRKGAGTKNIRGAFLGNAGRTVFMREGRARLPITPVMVIDVPQMFTTKRIHAQGVAFIKQRFPELMKAEALQELRRLR